MRNSFTDVRNMSSNSMSDVRNSATTRGEFRGRSNSVELDKAGNKNKHLHSQKLQLQKLIERLTHLGPQNPY